MKFQNVKGTRDFYPDDMAVQRWLIDKWRAVSLRSGFVEYSGPTFEYLDLYTAKSGEEIVSQLYHFEDRGGRQLALRPEMTPTLARMVAAKAASLPKPIKWFCVPNFFRAERPQRGRLREFYQWNVDVISQNQSESDLADAECIFVVADFFKEVGLSPEHVEIKINSRELLVDILTKLGVPSADHDAAFAILDKRDKLPPDVFAEQLGKLSSDQQQKQSLLRLGEARGRAGIELVKEVLSASESEHSPLGRLQVLFALLENMGVGEYCTFDMSIVRGLAYYTGVVFEAFSKGTLKRAVCGGGRYGNLLHSLGGPQMSGIGFGMGDVILLDQLSEFKSLPSVRQQVDFFVVHENASNLNWAMRIVGLIRRQGKRSCSFSYKSSPLKKQLQQAAQQGVKYALIGARDAAAAEEFVVKHMASGKQESFSIDRLLELLSTQQPTVADPLASIFAE